MTGLEGLFIDVIVGAGLYIGGYFHRYFTEPEKVCKTIEYQVPDNLKHKLETLYCKRGVDPYTKIDKKCYVNEPVIYEFTPDSMNKVDDFTIELQLNLYKCQDLIKEYNKDKFIMKD